MKNIFILLMTLSLGLLSCKNNSKEAILLVTFGSSYEAPQKTFQKIDTAFKEHYSQYDVSWAYTSNFIIKKLREGRGQGALKGKVIANKTPEEALKHLAEKGYSTIHVQSLHIIPGDEYDDLVETIHAFSQQHLDVKISIGTPLLTDDEDIRYMAKMLSDKFADDIKKGPVCFMGHGTPHMADQKYTQLDAELKRIHPDYYVGTVEGIAFDKGITSVDGLIKNINELKEKAKQVTLSPLMSVVGDHASNDMNGTTGESEPSEQSWRERFEAENYQVQCDMTGLGDYPEVITLWMEHLQTAIDQ
jgi:sirohydrochlorin cobaltochelatase